MSGHRHYRRRRSPDSSSSGSSDVAGGGHRQHKRSSDSLPMRRSHVSHHNWVLLNRAGARRDGFSGDHTTSAMSLTSKAEQISVSFELVEPPGTSVLTVGDWPRATTTPRKSIRGEVIAAHRDVVLLEIRSYAKNTYPSESVVDFDLFVYQASRDPSLRRRPALLLLPSAGGSHHTEGMGIMSCTSNGDDDSTSFVVAYLEMSPATHDAHLFRSESGQWEVFKNLHVHGANGVRDLRWWSTDAVVPYGRRYMIWVDYYRGMVLMDMSSQSPSSSEKNPPRLRYVPLPVDRPVGDPNDMDIDRGCPKDSRRVCVTRYGVMFVSVDSQHCTNFGVGNGHVIKWSHKFRITTWSLCQDSYSWKKDLTIHEEEFWDAFDGGDRFPFPHVRPEFPVVDVNNPDVVVFRLAKSGYRDRDEPKWMIEVDLRKKALLAAIAYSKKESDRCDAETINSARMQYDPIPSELPRYLDAGQACKKRRQ